MDRLCSLCLIYVYVYWFILAKVGLVIFTVLGCYNLGIFGCLVTFVLFSIVFGYMCVVFRL